MPSRPGVRNEHVLPRTRRPAPPPEAGGGGPGSRPSAPIGERLTAPWPGDVKPSNRRGPAARFPEPRPARRAPPPMPRPPPLPPRRSAPKPARRRNWGRSEDGGGGAGGGGSSPVTRAAGCSPSPLAASAPAPPVHPPRSGPPSPVSAVAGRAGGALIRPPARCSRRRQAGSPSRGHTLGGEAAGPARSRPSVWGPGGGGGGRGGGGGGRGLPGREGARGAGRKRLVPGSGARRRHHDVHPFRGPPAAGHRGPAQ